MSGAGGRPGLRLPWHRATTAHVASVYPWSVQASFGHEGVLVGVDLLSGGGEFCWDPFTAYASGLVSNPNVWAMGEPGFGKSALIKTLLWRQAAVFGSRRRWLAICDPKGEYGLLAEWLGLTVVRLTPGGTTRINPLAPGPAAAHEPAERQVLRRAEMVTALVATVLDRPLSQVEDAVLFATIDHLTNTQGAAGERTLVDVARLVTTPTAEVTARLPITDAALDTAAVGWALDKLLSRSLRGMFDGPSTVPLARVWDGPGLVLDLSAVSVDSVALPLLMVAAAGWLQQIMACPGPQRLQVLDEAWALLANRHTASYLQSCFKLGRSYGVSNLCITHRTSDLAAQADDGSATAKIAHGLLADAATRIILRQAPDQLGPAATAFGLTEPEQHIIGRLARGRALWKLGGSRTAVVAHHLAPSELSLVDTDARIRGLPVQPDAPDGVAGGAV
ncbi:MAG TPA: hypothetical protein VFK43_01655, partial [Acidimicrobiales bacterium]|nr:hypothetical protein [Acidimicrobiales bacterium]